MMVKILQICYLNPFENYGGIEKYVLELSEALSFQYSVTVDILCAGNNFKVSKVSTGKVITLRVPHFGKKEFFFVSKYLYAIYVRKYLNQHYVEYSALHFHGDNGFIGEKFKEKTVLTLHGIARSSESVSKRISSYLPTRIEKNNVKMAGITFSVSIPAKEFFKNYSSKKEIWLIKQSIDISKYQIRNETKKKEARIKLKIEDDMVVGVITGRDVKRKGLDLAISAIESIRQTNIALFAIGFPTVEDVSNKVYFTGDVSEDIKRLYLVSSDFFIFPSKKEGFPISVLEAAAIGLPIIVSKQSGVSELENLVPFFREIDSLSPIDYSNAVLELINLIQKSEFSTFKRNNSAISQYSVLNIASQYMEAYKKLI